MNFLFGQKRRDRNLLAKFQLRCSMHMFDHVMCGPAKAPKVFHATYFDLRDRDMRPGLSQEISATLKRDGLEDLAKLDRKAAQPFLGLAKSALLPDNEFERFARTLPDNTAAASRTFRADWIAVTTGFQDLKARLKKFPELAQIYFKESQLALPDDALLPFVQTLDPEGWHQFICDCVWEDPGPADMLPAAFWIVTQPQCDRWTAVSFLAAAQASGIDDLVGTNLDHDLARKIMQTVSDNLRDGFYTQSHFAPISQAAQDVELARKPGKEWPFPFNWDKLGDPPKTVPASDIVFQGGRPMKSFDSWVAETGREF